MARRRKSRARSQRIQRPATAPATLDRNIPSGAFLQNSRLTRRFCKAHKPPHFRLDTRELDTWVQECLDHAPFIRGFIDQASMIHANRGYEITGGIRVVNAFSSLLHGSMGGEGFRHLLKICAQQYYMSNFGGVVYMYRTSDPTYKQVGDFVEWDVPPVTHLANLDPLEFVPNYNRAESQEVPYIYSRSTRIGAFDIFRVVSAPDWTMNTYGVGRSAAYRCCQVMSITGAVYDHILGSVNPETTKGILTISGYSQAEFESAIQGSQDAANEDMGGNEDIITLFNEEEDIKVAYQLLSRMPDNIDLSEWLKWGLTECAVHMGFPLEEFIGSHASTLLGQSGSEVEAGERRASTKGGGEFIEIFGEKFRRLVVPQSLDFQFWDRDSGAELKDIEILEKKSKIIQDLFEARQIVDIDPGERLIDAEARQPKILTAEEARRWLVEWGVAPEWLTPVQDDVTAGHDDEYVQPETARETERLIGRARMNLLRDKARANPRVQAGLSIAPNEPIVHYENYTTGGVPRERVVTLWDTPAHAKKRTIWTVDNTIRQPIVQRAADISSFLDEQSDLRNALSEAIQTQIEDVDLGAIASGDAPEDIVPTLSESVDEDELAALIALAFAAGVSDEGIDNVPTELSENYGRARAAALLYGTGQNADENSFGTDLENSIDKETVERIAAIVALLETVEDMLLALADLPGERAELIARVENARAYSAGQQAAATASGKAISKTWLPSTAKNPRPEHIEQYGVTVGYDEAFPNGNTWSGQEVGCQCGIKVNYEV